MNAERTVPNQSQKQGLGQRILGFSHTAAHVVGENIIEPTINISQYRTFENPQKHRRQIDRQMHRTFQRAGTTVATDAAVSLALLGQFALAVVLGEHVPLPVSLFGVPPKFDHFTLPFNVNLDLPIPPASAANALFGTHLPTHFLHDGLEWPILTSGIITAGAVNAPNAYRAFKERRPFKEAWYTASIPLAFTYFPLIFNSFWFELGSRPAERKSGKVFAEKVSHVLEGKPITHTPRERRQRKSSGIFAALPFTKRLREMATGDIHIHPKDRQVFVDAIENRFTKRRPRQWWEKRLTEVAEKAQGTRRFGLQHERERVRRHKTLSEQKKTFFGKKLWHKAWAFYHHEMQERAEEKLEAIEMAQDFMRLSKTPQAV